MSYDLKQIVDFIEKIDAEHSKRNLVLLFEMNKTWGKIKAEIAVYRQVLEQDKYPGSLRNFAVTLQHAANFLIKNRNNDDEFKTSRQEFVENQFKILKKAYYEIYPNPALKTPLPVLKPSHLRPRSALIRDEAVDPAVRELVENLAPFKELKNYLHGVLHRDNRRHSYWCFGDYTVKKVKVLNQFLTDFATLRTIDEMQDFLKKFYSERANPNSNSRFDTLNKGQNITTRLFGLQTTTINHIDKLALLVGLDPRTVERVQPFKNY